MKARVIATGEIVDIIRDSAFDKDVFYDSNGQKYNREELSFDFKKKSFPKDEDYWVRLEHQAAIAAMQGILSMPVYGSNSSEIDQDAVIECAMEYAHALVEKMKEEK